MNNRKITVESLAADERFQQYCLQPNAADISYWNQWLKKHPELEETFAEARALVEHIHSNISDEHIDQEWNKLSKTLTTRNKQNAKSTVFYLYKFRHAAAVLLLLAIGFAVKSYLSPKVEMQLVQTDLGAIDSILLTDQTKVVLNANSKIQFSENWDNSKVREVWLSGEAWFEVSSNPEKPFIVHTPKGDIRVLGTMFNAIQRAEYFDVVLEEGSIQLELENNQKIKVSPGEQVILNKEGVQKRKVNLKPLTAWRHGKLVFKNGSIQQIINRLQEEYGWVIKVEDEELLRRKVNASVPRDKPELLLKALKEIYEFDIQEIQKGSYLIR